MLKSLAKIATSEEMTDILAAGFYWVLLALLGLSALTLIKHLIC